MSFRAIFDGDLNPYDVATLIDWWISEASRSRLAPFVKAARTIANTVAGSRSRQLHAAC